MGETTPFQPLTRQDRITVVLYRAGIIASTVILSISAIFAVRGLALTEADASWNRLAHLMADTLLIGLYASTGISVFFIHLYVGKFHRLLKKIYWGGVVCLAVLFYLGNGSPSLPLFRTPPYAALLLLPLSGCLGFVTAKEAFCFRLMEGYVIALLMPLFILASAVGILDHRGSAYALALTAAGLVFFTFRKVFMPLHYDIGDKSAYQP